MLIVGLVVLGLVLAVVGGAVAIVVLAGGEDDLPAAEASDSVQAIVDAAEFDDEGTAPLGACPLGSSDVLVSAVAGNGAPPDVGDEVSEVYEGQENQPGIVCSRFPDGENTSGSLAQYAAGIGSGSYEDELDRVFLDAEVDVQEQTSFRGGEIYAYCVDAEVGDDGCGADWVVADEDLAVGFYAAGAGVPTAQRAQEVLEEVLPDWVDSLTESGPNLLSG